MQIDVLKCGVCSNRFREISLEKYTLDTVKRKQAQQKLWKLPRLEN